MYNFFAFIDRMRYIKRWGLMRSAEPESLTEHCYQVAVLAHALVTIENERMGTELNPERAAVLALFHDAPETITGDLPTPVKYYSKDIQNGYLSVEDYAKDTLLDQLPGDLQDNYSDILNAEREPEWPYVKAADTLSAYLHCISERNAGNRDFLTAEASIRDKIANIDLECVHIFEEEFLPSFGKTLDELAER